MSHLKYLSLQNASILALLLFFCIVLPHAAVAEEEGGALNQRLRLSAFGTLGLVYDSSDSRLSKNGQPDSFHGRFSFLTDSLLGAQADLHIADSLDATVQMVAKDRADQSLDESLELAFLRWRPLQDLTLRAGRVGFDLYLLSDCRNVGFAYLWARPVMEFYSSLMTDNIDGADASYSWKAGEGRVTAKAFGGVTEHSVHIPGDATPSVFSMRPFVGGRLSYEDERLRVSAGYAWGIFGANFHGAGLLSDALSRVPQFLWSDAPSLSQTVKMRNKSSSFYSLGAAYETDDWVFQGEAGYMRWAGLQDVVSGYLSAGRHLGSVTPYVVLAAAKSLSIAPDFTPPADTGNPATDGQLAALYGATRLVFKSLAIDQQTLTLGARWDFYQKAALKFQWDVTRVGADGSGLWSQSAPVASTTFINVLSANVNFAF